MLPIAFSPNPIGALVQMTSSGNRAARSDSFEQLAERWTEEASEAALSGNPQRAGYVEFMLAEASAGRLG